MNNNIYDEIIKKEHIIVIVKILLNEYKRRKLCNEQIETKIYENVRYIQNAGKELKDVYRKVRKTDYTFNERLLMYNYIDKLELSTYFSIMDLEDNMYKIAKELEGKYE